MLWTCLLLSQIPFQKALGLRPKIWLCVGAGYGREDIKRVLLSHGVSGASGFVQEAVMTLPDLAFLLLDSKANRGLDSLATRFLREEGIRALFLSSQVVGAFPRLAQLKKSKNFAQRIDRALQGGRMSFAHEVEERVYEEHLAEKERINPLRNELREFSGIYETWLEGSGFLDLPLLLKKVISRLEDPKWSPPRSWTQKKPEEIWRISVQSPESLEQSFWDALGRFCSVHLNLKKISTKSIQKLPFEIWHTLDDIAENLGEVLSDCSNEELGHYALVIPDRIEIRRTLMRSFEDQGIPLFDPRDPTCLLLEEKVKWALSPLKVVARNFERDQVVSWLRTHNFDDSCGSQVLAIYSHGIQKRLFSYSKVGLDSLHAKLSQLQQLLAGKKTCQELASAHLELLSLELQNKDQEWQWLQEFFKKIWENLVLDLSFCGLSEKKAATFFWLEKIQKRIQKSSPPPQALKPQVGVAFYRFQQAPVGRFKKVWILGSPDSFLGSGGLLGRSDDWFNAREREVLGKEFSVYSQSWELEERKAILDLWLDSADEVIFLGAQFDSDGRELYEKPTENTEYRGLCRRLQKSYSLKKWVQPKLIRLHPIKQFELSATLIDHYTRCSFQALAYHRWNLKQIRVPQDEPWPEVKGNLLHEAAALLIQSLEFNPLLKWRLNPESAVELVLSQKQTYGMIQSDRLMRDVKRRYAKILKIFCKKEEEYFSRSGARPVSFEKFKLKGPEFSVMGVPDRVDAFQDGLFIIDYKTSSSLPYGEDMVKYGYHLQLPYYAVAAQQMFQRDVLGAQFVELTRQGLRTKGVFFPDFNGKKHTLTDLRSHSKSLVHQEYQRVWDDFEQKIYQAGDHYLKGVFEAKPRVVPSEKECQRCSLADLCGLQRELFS